jgi:hypothetical protein
MKQVIYAGGTFLTSDAIAEALLHYAEELANHGRAASITVPAVGSEGEIEVQVLVGPASQLMAETAELGESSDREPDGTAFIEDIRRRIDAQRNNWVRQDEMSSGDWDI